VDVVELLVEAGADVNVVAEEPDKGDGGSVLRMAALNDRSEVVQVLLKAGAEIAQRGCQRAVKVLLQARDWPAEVSTLGRTLVGMRAGL
jgi:ankyrin repeat protein